MTAVMKMNVDDLNSQFVEDLKHQFAHSELEIRVQERPLSSALTENAFWDIIEKLDWTHEDEDDDLVIKPVVAHLVQLPLALIYRFEDILSEKLWHLDTRQHAQVFLDAPDFPDDYLSSDDFLYARCAVVANGRDYYEQVLKNPAEMPTEVTYEPLLYVSSKAYELKTGRQFNSIPAYNYETFSNKKGWES